MIPLLLVVGSFLALGGAPSQASGHGAQEDSCTFEETPDLGLACRLENGIWKIQHKGGPIGYTHGPDPVPEPRDGSEILDHGGKRAPVCARTDTDYRHAVIYARASNVADRYNTIAPQLKDLVHQINGHLNQEAQSEGAFSADYRFRCHLGEVWIFNAVLPTPKSQANFQTIVDDLMAQGYDNNRAKYWVWYDDTDACSCGGIGHIYNDDRLIHDNWNNGYSNAIPMFGVTFGHLGAAGHRIMMHENGHNMGAVQESAPNDSPGGYHCNDGQDIMCYDDSGSLPPEYDPNVCSGYQRFDCNKDDYFAPLPDGSNHLSNHWNVGSQLNRFLVIMVPFDVTATPTQQRYLPGQNPEVEVRVESTAGEPIDGADVQVRARYETSMDDVFFAPACVIRWSMSGQTHQGEFWVSPPSFYERCVGIGIGPSGEVIPTADGRWHVEMTITKGDIERTATTEYAVGL